MGKNKMEIRCISCGKLLGKVSDRVKFDIEMKCPRCTTIYTYSLNKSLNKKTNNCVKYN